MQYFSSDFKLGILGGGQLGKMLLYTTRQWDIHTSVLDPSKDAPARLACNQFTQGDFKDYQTVIDFGKDLDVLTIEIEHVNVEALEALQSKGVKVFPEPEALRIIRDKGLQKSHYAGHQIPTADFRIFSSPLEAQKSIQCYPKVWKSTKGGYDGNGVKIITSEEDFKGLPEVPCLLEDLVPFEKELAVIVASDTNGNQVTYPAVAMDFHPVANQVEFVVCPAPIEYELAKKAEELAKKVAKSLNITGLLAVELFLTSTGELLVNEVAPRPHNSGHFSLDASITDQFEQHLRAVLGLPLGNTESLAGSVMVNLVGSEGHNGPVYYQGLEEILGWKGVKPHIYGKAQTRPFRKMGHITVIDKDLQVAYETARKVKETIKVISL